jgi:hypothetical protein
MCILFYRTCRTKLSKIPKIVEKHCNGKKFLRFGCPSSAMFCTLIYSIRRLKKEFEERAANKKLAKKSSSAEDEGDGEVD